MNKALRARLSLRNPVHFLALGFGSGLMPFMPGTFGSLAALPLVLLFAAMADYALLVAGIVASVAGIYLCGKTAKDMQVHDHGAIVWDEVAGILLTFLWVPLTPLNLLLGFMAFRFFDIVKPWPIRAIDRSLHGGIGIMLDDLIAGLMACVSVHLILLYWPG